MKKISQTIMKGDDTMDIINLNGVEYIKKEKVEQIEAEKNKVEKDLQLIKAIIGKSFGEIKQLIDSDVIDVEKNGTLSVKKTRSKPEDTFVIYDKCKNLYEIRMMDEKGRLFNKRNRALSFTIKNVLKIQSSYHDKMTFREVKALAKQVGVSYHIFNTILYNLQQGVFDYFIQQFYDNQKPKINRSFKLPVENNVEKRKESGLY